MTNYYYLKYLLKSMLTEGLQCLGYLQKNISLIDNLIRSTINKDFLLWAVSMFVIRVDIFSPLQKQLSIIPMLMNKS